MGGNLTYRIYYRRVSNRRQSFQNLFWERIKNITETYCYTVAKEGYIGRCYGVGTVNFFSHIEGERIYDVLLFVIRIVPQSLKFWWCWHIQNILHDIYKTSMMIYMIWAHKTIHLWQTRHNFDNLTHDTKNILRNTKQAWWYIWYMICIWIHKTELFPS